jgi:exodeoxyribonuclease VII small subunit
MAERTSRTPRSRQTKAAQPTPAEAASPLDPDWLREVNELRYQDAQTALELAMAQLQSPDLEVEEMAGLYRRAEAYAARCAAVLGEVEQTVIEWDTAADTEPA